MRHLARLVLICLLIGCGWASAKDSQEMACVRDFLKGTAYEVPAKAKPSALFESAELFRLHLDLVSQLQPLAEDTAGTWCSFLTGPQANEIKVLAMIKVYGVDLGQLEEIDDGIGPIPFNFKPYKLATRYDGITCDYALAKPQIVAVGQATIDGGHLHLHDSRWTIGPGPSADAFDRFNIAITEKGQLVGTFYTWLNGADPGETAPRIFPSVFKPGKEVLGRDLPTGSVTAPIDARIPLRFHVLRCWRPGDQPPLQYAFDYSKFKLDEKLDVECFVTMRHHEGLDSSALLTLHEGRGGFRVGQWNTDGPKASFSYANLAITKDRHLVGILEVWWMFQERGQLKPPTLVVLTGKEEKLDKSLNGTITTRADEGSELKIEVASCKEP